MQSDAELHTIRCEPITTAVIQIFSSPEAKTALKGVKSVRDRLQERNESEDRNAQTNERLKSIRVLH